MNYSQKLLAQSTLGDINSISNSFSGYLSMCPDSFTAIRVMTACARVTDLVTGEAVWRAGPTETSLP